MDTRVEPSALTASDLFSDGESTSSLLDLGQPKYTRRITDKVLAAFNHAYVLDELELAQKLWEALVLAEEASLRQSKRREPNQAIALAEKWVSLVDSRRSYQKVAGDPALAASPEAEDAHSEMRANYRAWMDQFDEH